MGQQSEKVEVNLLQRQRSVALRSLRESIDHTTAAGKQTFHIFAALVEFEASGIRDRPRTGTRRRGAMLGRPRALTSEQVEMVRTMMNNPRLSSHQVAEQLGVHRSPPPLQEPRPAGG